MAKVTIIYLNWNTASEIIKSMDAIEAHKPTTTYDYCLVDNGSKDWESLIQKYNVKNFRFEQNMGFGAAANIGILITKGEYICLMNPDTLPQPGWLDSMVNYLDEHKETGLVGPCIDNVCNPLQGTNNIGKIIDTIDTIPFACVVFKRDLMRYGLIGLMSGEDRQFCEQVLKCGLKTTIVGTAYVKHTGHASMYKNKISHVQHFVDQMYVNEIWPRFLGK